MTAPAPVSFVLRASVLVTSCCGLAVLALTGLLSAPAAAAATVLLCAAAAAPVVFPPPVGRTGRQLTAAVAIVAGASLAVAPGGGAGSLVDVAGALSEMGRLIAPAMTGVLIAQFLVADRPRDLGVALVLGCMTFLLGIGMAARPAVVLPLAVAWPAILMALHEMQAARQQDRADVVVAPDPGEERVRRAAGPVALLAAVSAVIAVLAVLAIPSSDGVSRRNAFGSQGGAGFGGAADRSAQAYSSGVLDLRSRGQLPDTQIAEVAADSPTLWRGVVLSFYDGTTWRAAPGRGVGEPAVPSPPASQVGGRPAVRRDRVLLKDGFAGVVLAPGRPLEVDVRGVVEPLGGGLTILSRPGEDYPATYEVTSAVTDPPAAVLRGAAGSDPTTIDVLGLPPQLPARVRQLSAELVAGAPTRYDAVLAVERHLRANATYRLDSPVPPRGQDAVDHFLFEARTGFCEQFASAAAVLLRAAGIPTRLATGFSGGSGTGDNRLLKAADAHAWVEVWYPGVGWVASDPTAGTELADGSSSLTARLDALLRSVKDRFGLTLVLVLAAVGMLGAATTWLLRRRSRSTVGRRDDPARPKSPVLAAFARLEAALERAGLPRQPAESLSELARRLPGDERLTEALTVLEQVCYGPRSPEVRAVHDAATTIDDLAARVLATSNAS